MKGRLGDMEQGSILIVDDDFQFQEVLEGCLTPLGCRLAFAGDGEAALALLEDETFDVVLLDAVLPGMSGLDVLRCIQDYEDRPEVIIMTAHSTQERAIEALRLGAYDYVIKPFSIGELQKTVKRAVGRRRLWRRLVAVDELGREMALSLDPQRVAQAATDIVQRVLGVESCGLWLIDEERDEVYRVAACDGAQAAVLRLPLDGERGVVVAVARSGESLYVTDTKEEPRYLYFEKRNRSELALPLRYKGRTIGVLNLERRQKDGFPQEDVTLVSILASQTAVAMENARLYERAQQEIAERKRVEEELRRHRDHLDRLVEERTQELQTANERLRRERDARARAQDLLRRRNQELRLLNRIGRVLSSTLDLDEILTTLLEEVRRILDVTATSVWLLDPETGELVCRQATGARQDDVRGWRLAPGEGIAGWVVHHRQSAIVSDVHTDERYFEGVEQQLDLSLRSILSVPLQIGGRAIGVLQAVDAAADRFCTAERRLLEPLATAAASAIENARLYQRAREEIAERRQVERALEESERRLRNILDHSYDGIALVDEQGRIVEWNAGHERITGLSRTEVLDRPIWEAQSSLVLKKEKGSEIFEQLWSRFHEMGDASWFYELKEQEILRPDGTQATIQVVAFPIQTERGCMVGSITRDVTQHRRAQEALRRSEEKYRGIFEHAAVGIFQSTFEGRFLNVNPALARMLGYDTPQEVLDAYEDIARQIYVEPERRAEIVRAVHEKRTNVVSFENHYRRRNGEEWVANLNLRVILDEEGEPHHLEGFVEDITERKRAEARLRRETARAEALAHVAARLNARLDLETILSAVCEETARALDVPSASITLYDPEEDSLVLAAEHGLTPEIRALIRPVPLAIYEQYGQMDGQFAVIPDVEVEQPIFQEHLPSGLRTIIGSGLVREGQFLGTLNVHTLDEPRAFDEEAFHLLKGLADQAAQAIANARLFEQVRVGRERLQALSQRLVEAQETERRRIARELHDEIGQALTVIKINLQAAQRAPDFPLCVSHVEDCVPMVEGTLQQIRDLSLDLRPSLLDDLGLVPALRWFVDRQAQQMGFTATFSADSMERMPPEVEIASFRIAQEALTNVARHAQARHVDVQIVHVDGELELIVQDDGQGFDVMSALSCAAQGESLGLLSMQERASLVGGRITFDSEPGRGTTVRARIPLAPVAQPVEV